MPKCRIFGSEIGMGQGNSSASQCLPGKHEVMGLIPGIKKKKLEQRVCTLWILFNIIKLTSKYAVPIYTFTKSVSDNLLSPSSPVILRNFPFKVFILP